ncbi:cathepsin L1 [Pelomyxa schiedti]|nr:cathepsin L1 [Pelomyxa schiedti]
MKGIVLLLFVAAAVASSSVRSQFHDWAKSHGRNYATPQERDHRFSVWRHNLQFVEQHNAEGHSWTVGMNEFADLTNEEYRAMLSKPKTYAVEAGPSAGAVVANVDWRTKNVVCPIKDQGSCGSCWAFSAIASTESCYAIATGSLKCFSEQQLVDCAGIKYGDLGCGGGLPDNGFKYIIDEGCETQDVYPYTAKRGTCVAKQSEYVGDIQGFTDVTPAGNEVALQNAVVLTPVSVGIDASLMSFQLYTSGVYCPSGCSTTTLDHGVAVVGQQTDAKNGDYYIVRNSWGTSWGQSGYIWMCANKNNTCGIATTASYPTKCGNYA